MPPCHHRKFTIDQPKRERWENTLAATRFVRDASAGALFIGATVLSGGTAAVAAGAAGTALTFTGNTQDNLAAGQSTTRALRNAAISTSFAVVTNVLVPRGLSAVGRGMSEGARLTMGQNVALGLISTQLNIAADGIKTGLTASSTTMSTEAQQQFSRQMAGRAGFEVASMVFQSWLQARGIPARAILTRNEDAMTSATGALLSAAGDRLVACIAEQNCRPEDVRNLDLLMPSIDRVATAEQFVRETAMRPA